MIRKTRSLALACLTVGSVVALSTLFACMREATPSQAPASQPAAPATPSVTDAAPTADARPPAAGPTTSPPAVADERGKLAYERLRCSLCHSIGGQGNTNSPLDGVGKKHDKAALRHWTIGTGPAKERLPAGIVRMKSAFADDQDLDALVDYLAGLR
ncbi:MAG: cytochrome c [Planctomycetes bacterium]|nr:cytochrome c [Planctomycetota bacterium]